MSQFARGISPQLLLSQVQGTMPYLFSEASPHRERFHSFPPANLLQDYARMMSEKENDPTHVEYFRLCVCAHYSSCGTPVPTDVDNQIRLKLWPRKLSLEMAIEMADFILESRGFDFTAVTTRFTVAPLDSNSGVMQAPLSGHLGEWFTLASAAYCAFLNFKGEIAEKKRAEIFSAIADEVRHHSEIFGALWKAGDGLGALQASANIAHNFGDLDRVMDMWDLSPVDPLRLEFYKLGSMPFNADRKLRYLGRLWVAGELYKSPIEGSAMAFENHRHFALRKPKCLRESPLLLVPNGPFFDAWGKTVAEYFLSRGESGSEGGSESLNEVIDALIHGWNRLPKTMGYGRALRGILEVAPELAQTHADLGSLLGDRTVKEQLNVTESDFESKWSTAALHWMDEIPSRA
jgi:hypothetical protein